MGDRLRPNLYSGTPFWLAKNGLAPATPALTTSAGCDVAIIGAGITGALVADALTAAGLSVMLLDRRESGIASTVASTALLQYEIDLELNALIETVGRDHAERAYLASAAAVSTLTTLAIELGGCDVQPRSSLYLASKRGDARRLQREVDARAALGLAVEWWPRKDVEHR